MTADLGVHAATTRRARTAWPAPRRLVLTALAAFAVAVAVTVLVLWPHQPMPAHAHLIPPVIVPGSR